MRIKNVVDFHTGTDAHQNVVSLTKENEVKGVFKSFDLNKIKEIGNKGIN